MLSNTTPSTDYVADLMVILRKVEQHIRTPYYDRAPRNTAGEFQNVTIGDGINIDWSNTVKLKLVLDQLGLVNSSAAVEANRRTQAGEPQETSVERTSRLAAMVTAFRQVMINNRPSEGASPTIVNARNANLISQLNSLSALFGGPDFELSTLGTQGVRLGILHKSAGPAR
jgi:hypothetical protein